MIPTPNTPQPYQRLLGESSRNQFNQQNSQSFEPSFSLNQSSRSQTLLNSSVSLPQKSFSLSVETYQNESVVRLPTTSAEFLNQITFDVNTQEIYQIVRVFYFTGGSTQNFNDYVGVVLRIQVQSIAEYFGGRYLLQIWKNKERLFQFVHQTSILSNYYCSATELCYMIESEKDKSQNFVYIVKPFKQQFGRILIPFESVKDVKLFINNEILIMARDKTIEAVKLEDLVNMNTTSFYYEERADRGRDLQGKVLQSQITNTFTLNDQIIRNKFVAISFQSDQVSYGYEVLGIDEEVNEALGNQICIFAVGQKDILLYTVRHKSSKTTGQFTIRQIQSGQDGWNDIQSKCFWDDRYIKMVNVRLSPQSKLYALHTEKGFIDFYINMNIFISSTRIYQSFSRAAGQLNSISSLSLHKDIELGTEGIYSTLQNGDSFIYPLEGSHVQRIDLTIHKQTKSIPVGMLNEKAIKRHVKLFSDVNILNDVVVFTHGCAVSVYHLGRKNWSHRINSQSLQHISNGDNKKIQSKYDMCLFGKSQDDIIQCKIVSVNLNSVYEIFKQDVMGNMSKLIYYSNGIKGSTSGLPHLIEQKVQSQLSFRADSLLEAWHVQGNCVNYREFGCSEMTAFFQIRAPEKVRKTAALIGTKDIPKEPSEIFKTDSDCQLIQLLTNVNAPYCIVRVLNESPELLYLFDLKSHNLVVYDIQHVTEVMDFAVFTQRQPIFEINKLENFDCYKNQLFKDDNFLYYLNRGLLYQVNITNSKISSFNLGFSVFEVLAIYGNSVYFKNDSLDVYFLDLDWLKDNSQSKIFSQNPIFTVQSVIFSRFEFDVIGNKIATWIDPYVLKVFPPLNYNFVDCIASHGVEKNAIAWSIQAPSQDQQITNYLSKVSAFDSKRDEIITWNAGSGQICNVIYRGINNFDGFLKHSEWENSTLVYKVIAGRTRDYQMKAIWRKIEISNSEVIIHTEFEHQFIRGRQLFVSSDNELLLEFWDGLQACYTIKNGITNRIMEEKNTFSKVTSPVYFSPDFRTYLAYEDLYKLNLSKLVVWEVVGNEKPQISKNKKAPNLSNIMRLKGQNPVISLINQDSVSYLDINNLWVRKQIKKESNSDHYFVQESYLTDDQVARFIQMHMLNKKSTKFSSFSYTEVLQIQVDQHKQVCKKHNDRSSQLLRFYTKGNLRLMSSFSYYHWLVIEQIEKGQLSVTQINKEVLKELISVILPDGDTVLHRLIKNNIEQFELLLVLLANEVKINILPDRDGKTALHLCSEKSYSRAANLILETIGKYPLDDHASFITDALKDLLVLCPISLAKYFENRVIKPTWGITQTDGNLKKVDDACDFGVASLPMKVQNKKTLQKALFVQDEFQKDLSTTDDEEEKKEESKELSRNSQIKNNDVQKDQSEDKANISGLQQSISQTFAVSQLTTRVNMPMTYEIIDFPNMHIFGTEINRQFLNQLAQHQDVESLFETKFVRALLEYQLPPIKRQILWKMLLPYLFYLLLFNFYAIWIFEQQYNGTPTAGLQNVIFYGSQVLLLILTFYFLFAELRQLRGTNTLLSFFGNAWNIIDIVPLILVTISISITLFPQTNPQTLIYQRYLNAVSLFLLWIKMLYFFRIERSFSYLINLLTSVVKSIMTFLWILALAILAFAGSFFMLAQNNTPANNFAPTYLSAIQMAFELAVGNYDRTQFGTVGFLLVYIFFLIASLMVIIVMMNLLISIVSDTYGNMQSRADITLYKEFVEIIVDSYQMVSARELQQHNSEIETDHIEQNESRYLCIMSVNDIRLKNEEQEQSLRIQQQLNECETTYNWSREQVFEAEFQLEKDQIAKEQRILKLKESLSSMSAQLTKMAKKLN